jgi:hypothetical protein
MLVVLVISVVLSNWKMDKLFGVIMLIAYIGFCGISILLETGHLTCPLKFTQPCNK